MKYTLSLLMVLWGMSFKTIAQITLDANGNFNNNNTNIFAEKALFESAKTASNSPIIIHRIPSPSSITTDIAFDGVDLWVGGYANYLLYKISTVDGSVLKTIPTNILKPYGLEFFNGFLWVADADNKLIQQVDTANGNIISSFFTPSASISSYPTGLAWDGQYLWNNDPMETSPNSNDSVYQITTNGQIIQSHHAYGTYVSGLAFDGQYLWSSNNPSLEIYKIDLLSFTVVDTINAPNSFPNGLAFDGQYLWVACNSIGGSDSIYQIDISNTIVGLSENILTKPLKFLIYPNPSTSEITLELFNIIVGSTYSITDQTGRQIMTGKTNDKTTIIDINQLAEGIYLLQVGEREKQSFKVIKK